MTKGYVENAITQHGTVRAVSGWVDAVAAKRYVCVFHPSKPYLFKIIYQYPRPDLLQAARLGGGFVAEIVYGADEITASLPAQEPATALLLDDAGAVCGSLVCEEAVQQALTAAYAKRVAQT
jgi:hypothetical protein